MKPYQHILLACDYSQHGLRVAQTAQQMAAVHQAKLSIVHILDNIAMPDTSYGTVLDLEKATDNTALEQEKAQLIAFAADLNLAKENCWLIWGRPKQEIVELAKQLAVDLIVIGSHGRHGLALLLGSTANSVLHYAPCDVLAVKLVDAV